MMQFPNYDHEPSIPIHRLDPTQPLEDISAYIQSSLHPELQFEYRLTHCLPTLFQHDQHLENRIMAAFLCHYPYRKLTSNHDCQPFRQPFQLLLATHSSSPPSSSSSSSSSSQLDSGLDIGTSNPLPPLLLEAIKCLLEGDEQDCKKLASTSASDFVTKGRKAEPTPHLSAPLALLSSSSPNPLLSSFTSSNDDSSSAAPATKPSPVTGDNDKDVLLLLESTSRILTMAEQRHLLNRLQPKLITDRIKGQFSAAEGARWPEAAQEDDCHRQSLRVSDHLQPRDLPSIALHNPLVAIESISRLCAEVLGNSAGDSGKNEMGPYFSSISSLPPSLRSFDLMIRLLKSRAPAPLGLLSRPPSSHSPPGSQHDLGIRGGKALRTTVSALTRTHTLGRFLTNCISHLESREKEEEDLLLEERREGHIPESIPDDLRGLVEQKLGREVGNFVQFVRALINSALIFPPDLAEIRRQVDGQQQQQGSGDGLPLHECLDKLEEELQTGTDAMLIELRHFALRFGRYREGARLFGELNSLG